MRIYVASSWRNEFHKETVEALTDLGHDVYDFKSDLGASFHWNEVGVNSETESLVTYLVGIDRPRAKAGFRSDMGALATCDLCVMLLPCGKSAHLELGYAVGAHKLTAIIINDSELQPELMYKMVDHIAVELGDFIAWLNN